MEGCKGNINCFCYVCGKFTPLDEDNRYNKRRAGAFSEDFIEAYKKYFNQPIIKNVNWVPNAVCVVCYNALLKWKNRERVSMPFGVPMIWTNPGAHNPNNCYACVNSFKGMNKTNTKSKVYTAVPSAQIPILHREGIPVPTYPTPDRMTTATGITAVTTTTDPGISPDYSMYDPGQGSSNVPIPMTQADLDHIVCKLELTQRKSEMLASYLKEKNLLAPNTKVTAYRSRQKQLQTCFIVDPSNPEFAYCPDVENLMKEMGIVYKAEDWRLFIDGSTSSLKAVLLHKTNSKPSVPVAFSTDTKETHQKFELILIMIDYEKHKWRICCDLKVVAILCGLQERYVKYMCYLCKWDTRFKGNQYRTYSWKERGENVIGEHNIIAKSLVDRYDVQLPLLHIKLGIVQSLIKAVVRNKEDPEHGAAVLKLLREIFNYKISEDKLSKGKSKFIDI